MRTNYTPGPWTARVVDTINDAPAYWHITDQHRGVVGDVQSVNPADARLIAAAPDMLAALREADTYLHSVLSIQHDDVTDAVRQTVLAAIARAIGGDA